MSCIPSDLLIAINRLTISFIFVVIKPQYYAQPTPIVSILFSHRFFWMCWKWNRTIWSSDLCWTSWFCQYITEIYGPLFPGDSLSITITPADGFSFDQWSGTINSVEETITIFGTQDHQLNATLSDVSHLPEEVEVYKKSQFDPHPIFAVLLGANTSVVINKDGEIIQEYNFENRLGNDIERLPNGEFLAIFKPMTQTHISLGAVVVCSNVSMPTNKPFGNMSFRLRQNSHTTIWSNPVGNRLAVESPYYILSLSVYDLSGREVLSQIPNKKQLTVNTYSFAPAVYLLRVQTTNGIKTVKLVKR